VQANANSPSLLRDQFVFQLCRDPNELRSFEHGFFASASHQDRPVRNQSCMVKLVRVADLDVPGILK
jgi:hypothetical protein